MKKRHKKKISLKLNEIVFFKVFSLSFLIKVFLRGIGVIIHCSGSCSFGIKN
jgi:hypothetical protein